MTLYGRLHAQMNFVLWKMPTLSFMKALSRGAVVCVEPNPAAPFGTCQIRGEKT